MDLTSKEMQSCVPGGSNDSSGHRLRVEAIRVEQDLHALSPAWSELLGDSCSNEPMLSPLWMLPWWQHYGGGRELDSRAYYAGSRLVGLVLCCRRRYRYRFAPALRRLEFMGCDDGIPDGVCSEYLNIIARKDWEQAVARQWMKELAERRDWDEVVLPNMPGESSNLRCLVEAAHENGIEVEVSQTDLAPYVCLPADWESYLEQLGRHRRYLLKTLREFEAWAGNTAEYHRVERAEQLDEGMAILRELHRQRWQAVGRAGVFASSRFNAFHQEVAAQLHRLGRLELAWLTVNGKPIAAVYSIAWEGRILFYQSGRAVDLPKQVRPGIVLHAHCIRQSIAAGCREYDFLAGDTQYKRKLATSTRPLVRLRLSRRTWRERVRRGLARMKAALRVRKGVNNR